MQLNIPSSVSLILKVLNDAGFKAYAVGGCVRDSLLGRQPQDWDITTSARPEEVQALFRRTVPTGIEHGTVTVLIRKEAFEVTTFRIDGKYTDHRHPEQVTFTPELSGDLLRRDFTINAMAYHPEEGLVDLYGGLDDLKNRVIRAVGDPGERFREDALRILRAVRFSAQLDFAVEPATMAAASALAPSLKEISCERIRDELTKLLCSPHPSYLRLLYEQKISPHICPFLDGMMEQEQNNPYHCYSVGDHTLAMLEFIDGDPLLRWTAFLHDCGKLVTHSTDEKGCDHFYRHGEAGCRMAEEYLRSLHFDNDTVRRVSALVRYHDMALSLTEKSVRRAVSRVSTELFPLLLKVMRADNLAKSELARTQLLPAIDRVEEMYRTICERKDCVTLKELAVTGKDLIDAGLQPGPEIGKTLQAMLDCVLEYPEKNTKDYLMKTFAGK